MYREKLCERKFSELKFNNKQNHLVCKVDQFSAKEFNNNDFGWSANTISAMAKAATYSEFMAIAQSISNTPAKYNLPAKCSLKDALSLCRPRMAQSPAELDMWAEQLATRDMEKLNDAYEKALQQPVERIRQTAAEVTSTSVETTNN